jgi:hypothetical protein
MIKNPAWGHHVLMGIVCFGGSFLWPPEASSGLVVSSIDIVGMALGITSYMQK